jgi:hypothetical protein
VVVRLWREPSAEHETERASEHQKTNGGHWETPFGVQISTVHQSTRRGRVQLGASDGMGVRHRETFRCEKRTDGERGDDDHQAAKQGALGWEPLKAAQKAAYAAYTRLHLKRAASRQTPILSRDARGSLSLPFLEP